MRGGSRRPQRPGVERGRGRELERERAQPPGWRASGAPSQAKPGQMALQPSGAAPVQPGPTLAVQTFLYPNKTIKPSSMKRSLHRDCAWSKQPETTHIRSSYPSTPAWLLGWRVGVRKGTPREPSEQLSDSRARSGQSVQREQPDPSPLVICRPFHSGLCFSYSPEVEPGDLRTARNILPSKREIPLKAQIRVITYPSPRALGK